MADRRLRTRRSLSTAPARYTVVQGEALEAVGDALKRRRIDFAAATELRNLVRAGRVDEVRAALRGGVGKSTGPSGGKAS